MACLKSGEAIAQSFPAKASPRRVVTVAPKTYHLPIGSMYGIYANIGGILMVNVTI